MVVLCSVEWLSYRLFITSLKGDTCTEVQLLIFAVVREISFRRTILFLRCVWVRVWYVFSRSSS
jgi:hypothetical protein